MPRGSALLTKFLAGSFIFYVLSGLTSFLNYLFYPVVAHFVNVSQYGEIQFLVSMFGQLSIGFVVLNILAIIIGVRLPDKDKQQEAIATLTSVSQLAALIITGIGVAVLIVNRRSLSLSGIAPIVLLGISLLANVPFTIVMGRLQGTGKFVTSGIVSVLSVAIKLCTALLLVVVGYGVSGVMAGITIGLIAAWTIGEIIIYADHHRSRTSYVFHRRLCLNDIAFLKYYALTAILAITILTLLSSADSIVSRIVLTREGAGQYAAIATITKVLLALATPLMWLALPPAVNGDTSTLRRYLKITALACGLVGSLIIVAPTLFTTTLIGINPARFLPLIVPATIAMTFCALAFLTLTICICQRRLRFVVAISCTGAVLYILSYLVLTILLRQPLIASLCGQITASCTMFIFSYIRMSKPRVQG